MSKTTPPTTAVQPSTPAAPAASSTAVTSPPPTTAVYKVDSSFSRVYTHVHAPLVLSTVFLGFPTLIAEPVSTLLYGLVPVALLQSAYCATCLQPALGGPGLKGKKPASKKKKVKASMHPGAKAKREEENEWVGPAITISSRIALSLLLTIASAAPLFVATILFGAPLTTHLPHTILLTLHMALIALFPLFFARPLSARHWLEILSLTAPLDEVYGGFVGTLVGAWLGAIPIPLDWDRPWQAWPVTVVVGAYAGWGLGKQAGVLVAGGWRGSWA